MKTLLIVGSGSFIGGVLRYIIASQIFTRLVSSFPYGTLAVNLLGCFAIGVVFGLVEKTGLSSDVRIFLMTGVLGGFTTFSAFSNETAALIHEGNFSYAGIYIFASIAFGVILTFAGIGFARLL